MRKTLMVTVISMVVTAGWLVGAATGGTAVVADPYARATSVDHEGWSVHCESADCPIPIFLVDPWVTFDTLGPTFDGVITASFSYRTTADVRLRVSPSIEAPGPTNVPVPSSGRELAPAPKTLSATLSWVAEGLSGGTPYDVGLSASPAGGRITAYDIRIFDITVAVEGTPA